VKGERQLGEAYLACSCFKSTIARSGGSGTPEKDKDGRKRKKKNGMDERSGLLLKKGFWKQLAKFVFVKGWL